LIERRASSRLAIAWPSITWLAIVLVAAGYLGVSAMRGIPLRTDLLSLLPADPATADLHQMSETLTDAVSRQFVLLVGHVDRDAARAAAATLEETLVAAGVGTVTATDPTALQALWRVYLPYAEGLLASGDRDLLRAGHAEVIAKRALAQIYGVGSFADAQLLAVDPFLLLPRFLSQLPVPLARLVPDEGRLTAKADGMSWVLVSGEVVGDPYALDPQQRFTDSLDGVVASLATRFPGLSVKRTGAVFFAREGARSGLQETSTLGTIASVGTILLLVGAFRRAGPLLMNLLALGVGIGFGLVVNLLLFGEVHIATLLFGVGLTGVAVDYGIHYTASVFDPAKPDPGQRLKQVLPGITLGLVTTLIGYAIMLAAPFPALRQVAIFSVAGLTASFLTVVLWFPWLDRGQAPAYGPTLLRFAGIFWQVWETPRLRRLCWVGLAALALVAVVGLSRMSFDDDVRRMQALSPDLLAQQAEIQRVAGASGDLQFLLIDAADDEAALQQGEVLAPILTRLVGEDVLAAYRGPADFVPSRALQQADRALRQAVLYEPYLAKHVAQLGMRPAATHAESGRQELTLQKALQSGVFPFLRQLVLAPGQHVIALEGLRDGAALRAALSGMSGVSVLDPAADFSERLGTYRGRALWLIGLSALLMAVPLAWRYGLKGGVTVLLPSLAALIAAPALIALTGESISFFHVMGLILVLAIGVDYATFCAEADHAHRPVTMLAVLLDVVTTLLSFGLLAFSGVFAVHAFGLTMLIGILVAFLLAPIAGDVNPRRVKRA
jgi:predicted exporter